MPKALSFAALAVGIVLIIFGINAMNSFASDVSEFFSGNPTNKSMWLLGGGILIATIGAVGTFRGRA